MRRLLRRSLAFAALAIVGALIQFVWPSGLEHSAGIWLARISAWIAATFLGLALVAWVAWSPPVRSSGAGSSRVSGGRHAKAGLAMLATR
jgi:hypothetical protein